MDFFSAVADPTQPIIHNDRPIDNSNDSFAEAIASRYGSGALLTTRLTPAALAPPPIRLPNSPMANMTLAVPLPSSITHSHVASSPSTLSFTPLAPAAIHEWIGDPTVLILDIRPHVAHSTARIPRAVSLSVPSTLLKRPLFSLQRLADMLPSANARARFSSWRSASRILVYDADSSSIPESSNIYGLLRKFKNDDFHGDLAWLKGGFQAVWRQQHDIIDTQPPTPDLENDDDDDDETKILELKDQSMVLRTKRLPLAAFSLSTTTVSSNTSASARDPLTHGTSLLGLPNPSQNKPQPAFNPFFDAVRQNLELSHGITERIPLRLPRRVRHRIHHLPFPWLREIARRAAKLAPRIRHSIDYTSSTSEESEDDENNTSADVEEGKEALAMQFFKIEVAEQRRLMGIMEHHSKETAVVTANNISSQNNFPYSITAGVEKGAKNRYRHIWPFEHARVRLHQQREADDDYVNASFIQPIGTNKRYIATQGPLPATFIDFWTLCWEQNVHVIVMLTKEVENSMVKCGCYWTDTAYGSLRLRMISTTGVVPAAEEQSFFGSRSTPQRHQSLPNAKTREQDYHHPSKHLPLRSTRKSETIRRVFELSHSAYPEARPRRIIHLQYLEWPDMNVPDDPRGILGLVKEVEGAVNETTVFADDCSDVFMEQKNMVIDAKTGISKHALGKNRPVLLHCSAGVGRTGGFIAVDSVLDAIRREVRSGSHKQKLEKTQKNDHHMDVDVDINAVPETASSTLLSVVGQKLPTEKQHNQLPPITAARRGQSLDFTLRIPNFRPPYKHRAPVQVESEGTDPEASESDRDIPPSSPPKTDPITNTPMHNQGTEPIVILCTKSPAAQETPNSSENSLLDLVNVYHKNGLSANSTGKHHLSKSSSLATSISSDKPFSASPIKNTPPSPSIAHSVSSGPSSENDISIASEEDNGDTKSNACAIKDSLPRLGASGRRRSSSPSTRNPIDNASKYSKRIETTTFSLQAPAYTGGVSSEAETPSRSISPSADEGSVASQVSSYHTYLKNLHYQPLDPKALPVSQVKAEMGNVKSAPTIKPNNGQFIFSRPTARPGSSSANYKEPRVLHETSTPPSLSSFEEPICEVLQDMREQRMSLCQSLRQYVFVHAAILEGALMIVDEESERMKEKERGREVEMTRTNIKLRSLGSLRDGVVKTANDMVGGDDIAMPAVGSGLRHAMDGRGLGPLNEMSASTLPDRSEPWSMDVVQDIPPVVNLNSTWPNTTHPQGFPVPLLQRSHPLPFEGISGNRSTSPTEYSATSNTLPVDIDSVGLLPKRPSVKRKQPSGEGEVQTRKRAQNESSSRERERDRDRESAWTSDGSITTTNLDGMASGLMW